MAEADETFYREVVRARGNPRSDLRKLAGDVADGTIDLEDINDPTLPEGEAARGRARDADAARSLLAAGARLVDAADARKAVRRPQRAEGRDDQAEIQALRRLGRPGVLAVPDSRLGRRGPASLVTLRAERLGPVPQLVFKTSTAS